MANSNKTVVAPPGKLGLILKNNGNGKPGVVVCGIQPSSFIKGKVNVGDVINTINGKDIATVTDVLAFPETAWRTITIVGSVGSNDKEEESCATHIITVPSGKLGLRLDTKHLVLEVLPYSPLIGKVFVGDFVVSINKFDVRNVTSQELVAILHANDSYERIVGIQRFPKDHREKANALVTNSEEENVPAARKKKAVSKQRERKDSHAQDTGAKRRQTDPKQRERKDSHSQDTGAKRRRTTSTSKRRVTKAQALAAANEEAQVPAPPQEVPTPPQPEPELPYALEDLPSVLQNLKKPNVPWGHYSPTQPGERLAVKKSLTMAYDVQQSIQKLESFLPQAEDCSIAHVSLSGLIETQIRQRDAILEFEKEKLTMFERDLRELVKFKIQHGHLDVVSKDSRAARVVARWRMHYKEKEKVFRGDSQVKEENLTVLEEFGFLWESPRKRTYEWDDMLEILKAYKEREGHCKVPQLYKDKDGYALGNWVSNQRKEYENWKCGRKTPTNPDRIQKLEELGFVWKLRYGRPKKNDPKFRNKRLGILGLGVGYDKSNGADNDGTLASNTGGDNNKTGETEESNKTDSTGTDNDKTNETGADNGKKNYSETLNGEWFERADAQIPKV